MATEARDAAIRDAKRYVREIVRNDWVFEPSSEPGVPSFSSPPTPDQDVLHWRQREYDSSGSELEPQPSPAISPVGGQQHASDLTSPLGTPLSDDSERRRKRRRQMEEEMQWNAGLRTWVERRDAWSGALSRDEIRAREAKTQQAATPTTSSSELLQNAPVPIATTAATPPLSATSATSQNDLALRTEASLSIAENEGALPRPPSRGEEPSTAAEQPPPPPPAGDDENQGGGESSSSADTGLTQPDSTHQQTSSEDPFIPVVSSLISNDNPIRASITPAMYPSIYSKVVIQGLTPTVPINLADVTKAMVQGWKSDGQWPPKPSSIVLQDTATVRPKPEEPAAAAGDKPPSSPESKRRSGVASAVRKVFHFSGFHPHHPFHRRGSSSQQNEGGAEGGVNQ
ncbi:hypothetical protein ASPBRDRAFT_116605 [Aspergillus brasiliensis CBS 101740]|uniref:Gag1-like clamp domain-containing protein n=1 Tax=Aspergillus brasiliensis (strain CBS 101740 / IMI 381727 / IBT 21946) TaxID=767769 RepID=A0A1L9UY23_ASPBC|nr:hypothetical protein ASPBRDRAFT_116605 [Aspergillus brasiliensis CBS 101740]